MKFYRGMRRDTAHVDQPQDSYRRARNIILDHTTMSVRTEGSLSNLQATDPLVSIGDPTVTRNLCGIIDLPQDRQLAIFENVTDATNELFVIVNNQYTRVFSSPDYNWSPDFPIKGVAYKDSRKETIVVWTDGENRPVYANIDATVVQVYDLFPEASFPNVRSLPVASNVAGEIENGTYSFFIAYEIDQDNLTTFSPSYGTYKIGNGISDKIINTQVGLKFDGLDTTYSYFRIYCIRNLNETLSSFYIGRQPTTQDEFIWTGQRFTDNIAVDQLTVPQGWYTQAETLTVLDDRLYAANLNRNDSFDGQLIADNIDLVWSIDGSNKWVGSPAYSSTKEKNWGAQYNTYLVEELDNQTIPANPDHYGTSMGFMPGCSYAFYIAFLLKDGSWTQAYHISAGNSNTSATTVTASPPAGYPTLGNSEYHGFLGSKSNGNGSYIHVMPEPGLINGVWTSQDITAQTQTTETNLWAHVDIGVAAVAKANTIIPQDVQDLIQGYSLFYAKPNANTRDVLGYIPYIEGRGQIPSSTPNEGILSTEYLSVYDTYLLDNKPSLNNFSYSVVYDASNTNCYDVSNVTTTSIVDPDFEYLPGNVNGLEFVNNNRENRLCIDVLGLDQNGSNASSQAEVSGTGDEGSQLRFGSDAPNNYQDYIDAPSQHDYIKIHKTLTDPTNYYTELDNQVLCACSYIEKNVGATNMRNVSWGGDTVAHPIRYRKIIGVLNSTSTSQHVVGQEYRNTSDLYDLYIAKKSYFTWSYALQGYEDLNDPTILTEEQELLYGPGNDAGTYAGGPEIMNPHGIPVHTYKKNDYKSAFTTDLTDPVSIFSNRIIRSSKQNYESNSIKWRTFAIANYYDNALNKGPIQNIESYAGELIIHHTDGIFKTIGKETLDTSAAAVFVGSGDIFRSPPQELIPTEEGYAGLAKHTDAKLTKGGYVFVDSYAGKVFKLSDSLADISQQGLKNYFREDFRIDLSGTHSPYSGNGYAIGYDSIFDRILITCITNLDLTTPANTEFQTISYSLLSDCWASNHTYPMVAYATNRQGFIGFTGARFSNINIGNNNAGAYIEPVFNEGGTVSKLFQSFQWMTRLGEGEGDWQAETFDSAIIYNDRYCSGVRTITNNARLIEESWNFNDFRNLILDANLGNPFFDDEGEIIADFTIAKPWYQQQRISGPYAAIRLIISPDRDITLYLNEALAKFRISSR